MEIKDMSLNTWLDEENENENKRIRKILLMESYALEYVSSEINLFNKDVWKAISHFPEFCDYESGVYRFDRTLVLKSVKKCVGCYDYTNEDYRDVMSFLMDEITENEDKIQYLSGDIEGDHALILDAIYKTGVALKFATENYRDLEEIVLAAVSKNGMALEFVSQRLSGNKQIVLAAVKESGIALSFADQRMKDSRDVVLAAVRQGGTAIEYASTRLRNDPKIARFAIFNDELAILLVGKELLNKRDFMKVLILMLISLGSFSLHAQQLPDPKGINGNISLVNQDRYLGVGSTKEVLQDNLTIRATVDFNGVIEIHSLVQTGNTYNSGYNNLYDF